jgi:precorrin-2/cobalt-factor-2 C20-methyltransferase
MGKIICTGLGPGDPDLMSLRAHRAVTSATQVAYFRKAGRAGQARRIVTGLLRADAVEHAMEYPVTTELPFDGPDYNDALARFYDEWAARLQGVAQTSDVVVLCEGDPFFYGSFMHLYSRLSGVVEMEVIPGITGMSGCWTATGQPITWGDDVLSVLMGTLPEEELVRHMAQADALVVMKTGRNLPKIRRALGASGRLDAAWLVEAGTMPNQRIQKLTEANIEECPYFAIVLVHGQGRRPEVAE